MYSEDYTNDESLKAILSELSNVNITPQEDKTEEKSIDINEDNLCDFILKNGAQTVNDTREVIKKLLYQLEITPDAELVAGVAEMVSSNNKALETLTKIHLNNEKLKQAKALEEFKQSTKLQIANNQNNKPQLTREDVMKFFYEADKDIKVIKK